MIYCKLFLLSLLFQRKALAWVLPTRRRPSVVLRASTQEPETGLLLYNSKTRKKEPFVPVKDDKSVSMYTCGPTVYDYAHVGNFRAFLTYDVMKRVLQYLGYDVTHICNLTDVDDKIINRANEQKLEDITLLTRRYEEFFMTDLEALNIVPATKYPRATEHIDDMMNMILGLRDNNLAYETSDGSWYFRTQSQPGYGKQLVNLDYNNMSPTERVSDQASEKEHFADFCLWKAFKPGTDRDDAAWESGDIKLGRPGWHLECSAMARHFFGDGTIDLHGGGVDLQFPHHENEIAQSEGTTGNTFCNCWFHNGFVNLDNEKMSKSLGNFLTLRTACPTPADVRAYRYLVVSSQYRQPLAFTPEAMKAAKRAVQRMDKVKARLEQELSDTLVDSPSDDSSLSQSIQKSIDNFEVAIRDDLSMPRASAALFAVIKAVESEFKKDDWDMPGLKAASNAIQRMDLVFGVFYTVPLTEDEEKEEAEKGIVPDEVLDLVSQRTAAKEAKDWELADSIRTKITDLGYAVKDVKGGEPELSRL